MLNKIVNTLDGTSVVYDVTNGVHTDTKADVRSLCVTADIRKGLRGKLG